MSETGSPEPEELSTPAIPPPSVRVGEPLIDSYSYFSCDDETAAAPVAAQSNGKGKERAVDDDDEDDEEGEKKIEGEWMLGVDEAGRGPVLGPQVYGIAFCKVDYVDTLKSLGFADSKTLSAKQRDGLLDVIMEHGEDVKWATSVMSPYDLSRGMLRRTPYNLNAQSHDATIALIRGVLERGYDIKQCYVDTVGIASDYQRKLTEYFPGIEFTVTSKADSLFPIVSAASIAAKVTRDCVLSHWTFLETGIEGREGSRAFGSGYPSDPNTKAWLEANVDPVFGYPEIVRFSWQTVRTILAKKGVDSKWNDEPAKIQRYFSGETGPPRLALWKDFGLQTVTAF